MIDRRNFVAASLALTAAGLAGCKAAASTRHVNTGFQRNGLLYLARTRGDFEKRLKARGITLSWAEFASGPPLIEAINAGAIDFGVTGDTPVIYAQAANVDSGSPPRKAIPAASPTPFWCP